MRSPNQLIHKLPIIVLLVFIISFFSPLSSALAHEIEPKQATPVEGSIQNQSPPQVKLVFFEEIGEQGSSVQVFNEQGQQVDKGNGTVDLTDPDHVTLITDMPDLPQGVYQVKWQVTLDDGDISQGSYYFGIGNVTLPATTSNTIDHRTTKNSSSFTYGGVGLLILLIIIAGIVVYFIRRRSKAKLERGTASN